MERPKPHNEKITRAITGEVAYLNEMRRLGLRPQDYPDDLSDMAIQMYENDAGAMIDRGVKPSILDEYEQYDNDLPELSRSCAQLAEALLTCKYPDSQMSFVDIMVDVTAEEMLAKVQAIQAGKVLSADDEQLAIPSNGEHFPILDITKQDSKLTDAGLRVFGWSGDKYVFTNDPDTASSYPEDYLLYPSDERSNRYEFDVVFNYTHKSGEKFDELVRLYIGQQGDLHISSQVWMSAYAETGYEGHGGHRNDEPSDEDVEAFADLIAGLVGNEPEAIWQCADRNLRKFIDEVPSDISREYLFEWLDNRSAANVIHNLNSVIGTGDNKQTLGQALKSVASIEMAHNVLVSEINAERTRVNALSKDKDGRTQFFGSVAAWKDRVRRES